MILDEIDKVAAAIARRSFFLLEVLDRNRTIRSTTITSNSNTT